MIFRAPAWLAPFAATLFITSAAAAELPRIDPASLRAHVAVLAADDFQGRQVGGPGQRKTLDYITSAFAQAGLQPAVDGKWLQAVPLIRRSVVSARLTVRVAGARRIAVAEDRIALIGNRMRDSVGDAPVVFVGYGVVDAATGRDDLGGADLKGKVILRLAGMPPEYAQPGSIAPGLAERRAIYAARGAVGEISIAEGDTPRFEAVRAGYRKGLVALDLAETALAVSGQVRGDEAILWLDSAGLALDTLKQQADSRDFRPVPLDMTLSATVLTQIMRVRSANVVGRLPGTDRSNEAVLLSAHWDGYGICRPAPAPDRICNGAIDNASGVAGLIELARALAHGPALRRSVIFIATTAEEVGLLGAEYYARHPLVPLADTLGGINLDTIALRPRGAKLGIIGRGLTTLDPLIVEAARMQGRDMLDDPDIQRYFTRSDHYALVKRGVPMVMVTGLFSKAQAEGDPVDRYFAEHYHQPGDELAAIPGFDGAAEDVAVAGYVIQALADGDTRPAWTAAFPHARGAASLQQSK